MSGIKKSQINLIRQEDLGSKVQFNFRQILSFFILVMVLTVLWNTYFIANLYFSKQTQQQTFKQQQKSYNELILYQKAFPNKQTSLILTNILEDKKIVYQQKKQVLDALNFNESSSFDGFYLYLEGLAEADIDQLWLTSFTFSNGMKSMQINGVAKQATAVTSYLKSLRKTMFSGATFNDIAIVSYAPNVEAIKFVISTKKVDENNNELVNVKTKILNTNSLTTLDENSQRAEQISNSLIGGSDD